VKDILQYFQYRTAIYLGIAIVFHQALPSSYGFFSSSPEKPPARIGYLAFQSPPKLRFHEVEPQADRRKLLTLEAKDVALAPPPIAPVTNPENSFPLISYGEDNNQSSPTYEIPLVDQVGDSYLEPALPPNDPFVSTDLPEPNLDNTDELMEILESDMRGSNRQLRTRVDFVPPYTMDGGNLIMQSKAKYTRKAR
jgi:hypothetical protein